MKLYPVSKPSLTWRERSAVTDTFDSGQLTTGPMVHEFEARFSHTVGRRYGCATSSGTTALHLLMAALGLGPGDEVLVPDVSFVATANAVSYVGAKPVLCDIDPNTWAISLSEMERKLTRRTRAIVVVHLYGKPANMAATDLFAKNHGLMLIEDAAEGLGGTYNSSPFNQIGSWPGAVASVFSFYGNKIITTGEGGMVVTNEPTLLTQLQKLRGQGQTSRRYYHDVMGFNYRMTDMAAALGIVQLQRLNEMHAERCRVVAGYLKHFRHLMTTGASAAPWLFTMMLPSGAESRVVAAELLENGIDTRPVFVPMHELPMFRDHSSGYPMSNKLAAQGISLPTYPELSDADVLHISLKTQSAIEHATHFKGVNA